MNFVKLNSSAISATAKPRPKRKWPISYGSVGVIAVTSDIAIILFCGVVSGIFYNIESFGAPGEISHYVGSSAVVAALFILATKGQGLYDPAELLSLRVQAGSTTTTWLSVFLFLSGAVFALKIGDQFSRGAMLSFAGSGLVLLIVQRILYRRFLSRGLKGQRFSGRFSSINSFCSQSIKICSSKRKFSPTSSHTCVDRISTKSSSAQM